MGDDQEITLREFVEQLVSEKERTVQTRIQGLENLLTARFEASEKAILAALATQEKVSKVIFEASEKAVAKAEDAQRELNIKNNEFRAQLKDQANETMSRNEVEAIFRMYDEKREALRKEWLITLDGFRKELEVAKEYQTRVTGREQGQHNSWIWVVGLAGFLVSLLSIISFVVSLYRK